MPSDATFPLPIGFSVDYSNAGATASANYGLGLVPPPTVANLRLKGSKLSVDVTCAGGCTGFLTLKTSKLRIARFDLTAPGTLTTKVRAAALRHLERHGTKQLRAVLTTQASGSDAFSLKLAR